MTWRNKLEQLITKSEFLFLEQPINVTGFLEDELACELSDYLGLNELGLSKEETGWTILLFLSILASYSKGDRISLSGILSEVSSGLNDLYHIETAINTLEIKQVLQKKTIKHKAKSDIGLDVIPTTIDKIIKQLPLPRLNHNEVLSKKLLLLLKDQEIELHDFHLNGSQKIIDLFIQSHQPDFIKKIKRFKSIKRDARYLLILLIAKFYADGGLSKDMSKGAIPLKANANPLILQIRHGTTRLQELQFVETDYFEFIKELWVSLTPYAVNKLGLELNKKHIREKTGGGGDSSILTINDSHETNFFKHIENSQIESETLFFNERLENELDFYSRLLSREDKVFTKSKAIRGRVILMFDGVPGTGKTAAAQQLAKKTKRDIVHVNWQTFRGQWVGQSEKNLKEMLEQIDAMAMRSKRVPVVLFNEAEAFLSQRIAIHQSTDRMENNLVSLLLEWLEKKNPFCIVVFTSNHRQLMDKAFERRISHITFDAPDETTRLKIWKSLSGELSISEEQCLELSQYPLTGAEIYRVNNTYGLHRIAHELDKIDIQLLHHLCQGQKWMDQKTTIGFKSTE